MSTVLTIKSKEMSEDEYYEKKSQINDATHHLPFVRFSAWYSNGTGNFKINQKYVAYLKL